MPGCNPGTKGGAYTNDMLLQSRVHITPAITRGWRSFGACRGMLSRRHAQRVCCEWTSLEHAPGAHFEQARTRSAPQRQTQVPPTTARTAVLPCVRSHGLRSLPFSTVLPCSRLSALARSAHSCRETRSCMWKLAESLRPPRPARNGFTTVRVRVRGRLRHAQRSAPVRPSGMCRRLLCLYRSTRSTWGRAATVRRRRALRCACLAPHRDASGGPLALQVFLRPCA
jgi:hypothetical protein